MAFEVDGLLHCADLGGHRIQVFTTESELVRTIVGPPSRSDTGHTTHYRTIVRGAGPFNQPTKMVTAPDGALFASDGPDEVCVDGSGTVYVAKLGERAALFPFMSQPWGRNRPARISLLDLNGRVLTRWGDDTELTNSQVRFLAPHGIAVDSQGSVYVAEVRHAADADPAEWRKCVRKLARTRDA